jgi:hypothetical protein
MRVPKWSSPERGAERVNFDALLGAFCALYASLDDLYDRLGRLEVRLLEEQFARPATDEPA